MAELKQLTDGSRFVSDSAFHDLRVVAELKRAQVLLMDRQAKPFHDLRVVAELKRDRGHGEHDGARAFHDLRVVAELKRNRRTELFDPLGNLSTTSGSWPN